MLAELAIIEFVLLVMLAVFEFIFAFNAFSIFVALVISAVMLAELAIIEFVLLVILAVFEFILALNAFSAFVALVISATKEVTFAFKANPGTVGAKAVPPKSPANWILPLVFASASDIDAPDTFPILFTALVTKAVVAI